MEFDLILAAPRRAAIFAWIEAPVRRDLDVPSRRRVKRKEARELCLGLSKAKEAIHGGGIGRILSGKSRNLASLAPGNKAAA